MNELALQDTNTDAIDCLIAKANILLKSGFLPSHIKRPEQAVAIMLRGAELGIGPMEALTSINMIKGKVSSSTQLMLALIYRSSKLEDIEIKYGDPATVMMKRQGMTPHYTSFGSEDARRANLLGKDNYKQFQEIMFMWRAIAMCARVVFPDIICAVYTPDELGSDVIMDTDWQVIESTILSPPKTWQELLSRTGKTVPELGGFEYAQAMTQEQIKEKWEEWK